MDPSKDLGVPPKIFWADERKSCPGNKMPARRRAGRATSSASEPASDGMVRAVYSYDDGNERSCRRTRPPARPLLPMLQNQSRAHK